MIDYDRAVRKDSVFITVKTYFLKDSSWVLNGHATSSGLHHEIGHFKISEIIARRVRAYLSQWDGNGVDNFDQYAGMGYYSAWKTDLNQEYDLNSNHSSSPVGQRAWDEKIDSLLTASNGYSDTLIVLPLRSIRR
jgi:hypothetical protein